MEFNKAKSIRYYRKNINIKFNYSVLITLKSKPIIKDSDIRLYKVFQKTEVTFNKKEVIELYKAYGNHYTKYTTSEIIYETNMDGIVNYIRDKLGNNNIYYDAETDRDCYFNSKGIAPNDLPDDYKFTTKVIIQNEDTELITKRSNKEQGFIKKSNELKSNVKIFKHFIEPTIQPICDEFGLTITNNVLYFKDSDSFMKFFTTALKEIIVKRFEEAGVTVNVPECIGSPNAHSLYKCETMFRSCDFRIMEGDDAIEIEQ